MVEEAGRERERPRWEEGARQWRLGFWRNRKTDKLMMRARVFKNMLNINRANFAPFFWIG